ncbi:hypothetical protein NDI37_26000, partial [Funiculus sociatus GB2-A5]
MSSHSLSVKLLVYGIDSKTAFLFNLSLSSEIPNGFYRTNSNLCFNGCPSCRILVGAIECNLICNSGIPA